MFCEQKRRTVAENRRRDLGRGCSDRCVFGDEASADLAGQKEWLSKQRCKKTRIVFHGPRQDRVTASRQGLRGVLPDVSVRDELSDHWVIEFRDRVACLHTRFDPLPRKSIKARLRSRDCPTNAEA